MEKKLIKKIRTKAEKLKQLADKAYLKIFPDGHDWKIQIQKSEELLLLIDDLLKHTPQQSKGLEREIRRYWSDCKEDLPSGFYQTYAKIARHFANWKEGRMVNYP